MAIVNRISEQEYRELALNDSDRLWELWDGVLVEKPLMSMKHEDVAFYLGTCSRANSIEASIASTSTAVRPASPTQLLHPRCRRHSRCLCTAVRSDPQAFNAFAEPQPLVVEIWSRRPGTTTSRRSCQATGSAGTPRSGSSSPTSGR